MREAFGVTFKIKQEAHTVSTGRGLLEHSASQNKKSRTEASDSEVDDAESSAGSDQDDEEQSQDSQDSEGEGSGDSDQDDDDQDSASDDDSDSGSEHSEEQDEVSDTASADHHNSSSRKRSHSSQAEANTTGQSLQRTTVLLSCYGVGYSNVYRKVT